MAKNWKTLLPKAPEQDSASALDLKASLEDLIQVDDTLKNLIAERQALEKQMKTLSGDSDVTDAPANSTFDQPIASFETKRKQDQQQFETKRQLEDKIAAKKLEFKHWENQRNTLKLKVTTAKKQVERAKTFKKDFKKDDFEARWEKQRQTFKTKVLKKPKDLWSEHRDTPKDLWSEHRDKPKANWAENRDTPKAPILSKLKDSVVRTVTKKSKPKPKSKTIKDRWGQLRDQQKEAKKLKAKSEKKWDDFQKQSMVESFDVVPKEGISDIKSFERDFKTLAQKEKDAFEQKQQKLKDKLKAKAKATKPSLTNQEKKEAKQEEAKAQRQQDKQAEEKREEDRKQRQIKSRDEKKQAQKREQQREARQKRKKDKYA
ncbi:hypothetical protein [Olleya sp. HaHaR_3_96]|uniref:hypothetical protein n=1 Tax=Olleya sp. HaHaR_3_96 TaxID=2745560 RepID=UPI001C4F16BA|nr:hypothetical protein [Olleya sp. HaHaR_3_96]QXP58760.1 hypothetical protein H0I26_12660 [Olleya sp. HaHaR_3_96]